jgi:hypothetical protein
MAVSWTFFLFPLCLFVCFVLFFCLFVLCGDAEPSKQTKQHKREGTKESKEADRVSNEPSTNPPKTLTPLSLGRSSENHITKEQCTQAIFSSSHALCHSELQARGK